ncbi:hypothetical protein [Nocardia vermiculata]|uniref:hypothetical protein n=1 Tax=Nocardia vermiculata TaxID=257274 RepID=UPI000AEB5FE1|nr:hypothetical protein [Nocardia vermiculata]
MFADDAVRRSIDTWTPSVRMPFAGHPCVGAAWLLNVAKLETATGVVTCACDVGVGAHFEAVRLGRDVDELDVPPPGEWIYAWQDESAGRVRARAFPGRATVSRRTRRQVRMRRTCRNPSTALAITHGRGLTDPDVSQRGGSIEIGVRVRRRVSPAAQTPLYPAYRPAAETPAASTAEIDAPEACTDSRSTRHRSVPSAGHCEHGNGSELRFPVGHLVIEADYQL